MPLAPEIEAFLAASAAAALPQVWEAPLAVIRRNTASRPALAGVIEPLAQLQNRFIPGPTSDLPIRIYRPSLDADQPVIIYFHGGGWVLNFLDIYDASLSHLANRSGATVISVNYQKAPEHPFPTPFDDCYATLLWVIAHQQDLSVSGDRIFVAGDSAGANLAAAVAIKARDNEITLAGQLLIYPCIDRDFTTTSYQELATGYGLSTTAMQWFWQQYLQGDAHDANPYAVPMSAQSLAKLAPAIIFTAEFDPLIGDGEKYAAALTSAGVPVFYQKFDGMIHGFFSNMAVTPVATLAIDLLAEKLLEL